MKCFICQKQAAIADELLCAACSLQRQGKRVCGKCREGELVETMRVGKIAYYECSACKERQMVQEGGDDD